MSINSIFQRLPASGERARNVWSLRSERDPLALHIPHINERNVTVISSIRNRFSIAAILIALWAWVAVESRPSSTLYAQEAPTQAENNSQIFLPYLQGSGNAPVTPPSQPVEGALFLDRTHHTYGPDIAVDKNGGMHTVYFATTESVHGVYPAFYAHCHPSAANDCGDVSKWPRVLLANETRSIQIELTQNGNPRVLIKRNDPSHHTRPFAFIYAACDLNCTSAAGWKTVHVSNTSDHWPEITPRTPHFFALDPEDRPRFVYWDLHAGQERKGFYYTFCDEGCTEAQNWYEFLITDHYLTYPALQFTAQGDPRILASVSTDSGNFVLVYLACDSDCHIPDQWKAAGILPAGGGDYSGFALRLDKQDRPRLVFYQGWLDDGGGKQLYYFWCNDNCAVADQWDGVALMAENGYEPNLALDGAERPRIAYRNAKDDGIGYIWCNEQCESAQGNWQGGLLESAETLAKDLAIPVAPHCTLAYWFGGFKPSLTLDGEGNPRILYEAAQYQRCTQRQGRSAASTIQKSWNAVRLIFVSQP